MGTMPGNIAKPRELGAFEDYINADPANLDAALGLYEDDTKGIGELIGLGQLLTPDELKHLRKHWFREAPAQQGDGNKKLWWPTFAPMGEVFREGLKRALLTCKHEVDEAGSYGHPRSACLPLDAYWICAGSHFELVVTLGRDGSGNDHHVNLLILSPSIPISRRDNPPGSSEPEPIWVVTHDEMGAGEHDRTKPKQRKKHVRVRQPRRRK